MRRETQVCSKSILGPWQMCANSAGASLVIHHAWRGRKYENGEVYIYMIMDLELVKNNMRI